jgi:hypothetical protein
MDLEFDVLGVAKKLVTYVMHFSKRKIKKFKCILLTGCPNNKRPIFGFKEF